MLGDHGGERADVLLVQGVDRRARPSQVERGAGELWRAPLAALERLDGRPTPRAVEEVYVPFVVDAHQQQAAAAHRPLQRLGQRGRAAQGGYQAGVAGQLIPREAAERPLLAGQCANRIQGHLELAQMVDGRKQIGEEGVWQRGRMGRPLRKAGERRAGSHAGTSRRRPTQSGAKAEGRSEVERPFDFGSGARLAADDGKRLPLRVPAEWAEADG